MGFMPDTEEEECERWMREQLQADRTTIIDFSTFKIIYEKLVSYFVAAVRSV